jgi:acyl dehydratase
MTIDYRHLKGRVFAPIRQRYSARDTALYALSVGLGNNPTDPITLPFVYEGAQGGLRALPTMAVVLGAPGFWLKAPDTGIDWVQVLHGEQRVRFHRPLPASAEIVGLSRVERITDKGAGVGALLVTERRVETAGGELLATVQQVSFLRADGGYSRAGAGQPSDAPLPRLAPTPDDRPPDWTDTRAIRPEAALLYRLSGDYNPLHADPAVAKAAGFPRPILHGLATYAMAGYAVLRQCAGSDPARLKALDVRFTSPVFPGETLQTQIWRVPGKPNQLQLRARVVERDKIVLSHGYAELA